MRNPRTVYNQHGCVVKAQAAHFAAFFFGSGAYSVFRICPAGVGCVIIYRQTASASCCRTVSGMKLSTDIPLGSLCSGRLSMFEPLLWNGLPRLSALQVIGIAPLSASVKPYTTRRCRTWLNVSTEVVLHLHRFWCFGFYVRLPPHPSDFILLVLEFPAFSFPFFGTSGSFSFPVAKVGLTAHPRLWA